MRISGRMPEVWISYNSRGKRKVRHFTDYKSKAFYKYHFNRGNEPQIHKENPMSEESTNETKEAPVVKNKKKATKTTKTSKKKTTTTKTKAPKTPPKTKASKTEKKSDLSKPQLRVLEYLKKQKAGKDRKEISEGAGVDYARLNSYIGSVKEERRKSKPNCLLELKLVKMEVEDRNGKDVIIYSLTAAGKKAS